MPPKPRSRSRKEASCPISARRAVHRTAWRPTRHSAPRGPTRPRSRPRRPCRSTTAELRRPKVRQAKETRAQSRLVLDQARRQIEQAVTTACVMNEGANPAIRAGEAEVRASTSALEGVRKENLAGARTLIDVLNAQQDLTAARARLIQAQRDRVVASHTLLAAIGRLDHKRLALSTPDYEPQTHYFQVRDAWHGLGTPAGQ